MCRERQCPWRSDLKILKAPQQKSRRIAKAASFSSKHFSTVHTRGNYLTFDWMGGLSSDHGVCHTMSEVLPTLKSNFNVDSFKKLNIIVDPFIPDLKGGSELFYRFSSCTEKLSLIMYGTTENSSTPTVMKCFYFSLFF